MMLTAVSATTDTVEVSMDEASVDEMFSSTAVETDLFSLVQSADAAMPVMQSAEASPVPLPEPPTIPVGLGPDMTESGRTAVDRAQGMHSDISEMQNEKEDCEEDVRRLEQEVADREQELKDAQDAEASAQSDFDKAKKDAEDADARLQDKQDELDDMQERLKKARRLRNEYARAISTAGRLSRQARRRGNHAEADGLGRQVGVNFRRYQEQVDQIRDLKKQIRDTRGDIRDARKEARNANKTRDAAERRLNDAKTKSGNAQAAYDDALSRLDEARERCERLCRSIEEKTAEYLGENGAHAEAVAAIEVGQQRKEQRESDEAAEEDRQRQEKEDDRIAQHFADHNEVIGQDLELPDGTERGDLTPGDINRLLGQQGGSTVPDDPTGEELAEAAVIKALNAQSSIEAISTLGYSLFGMAWNSLTEIFPLLGAMSDLFDTISGFQQFIADFQNGNLKVEENVFAPEWGLVKTTTIYNCNTGQYIVTSQVLFYYPSGSQHAGGAGRDGINIDPKHAGAYTVTYFGSVR